LRTALPVWLIPLLAAALPAQAPEDVKLTGTVLERDADATAGQFSVRAATSQVFRYRFDPKTAVERASQAIDVARIEPGDSVEVTSDQPPGAALRYAVSVRVLSSPPPRARYAGGADRGAPPADLSYSGVVSQVSSGRLTLRLRNGQEQALALRQDTSYFADGRRMDVDALKPAMRVFVEAGRSIMGQVEAYRVVWGGIMQP
jgi:hypothetical protein